MAASACVTLGFDGQRARIMLERPERHNALCSELLRQLDDMLGAISASDARVVTLQGAGDRAFCAGADLHELRDAARAREWLARGHDVLRRLASLGRPTIAVVHGVALGGGFELALACSMVVASTEARFGLPEPTLGLIPGLGGTQRLQRQIGTQRANRLLLTGDVVGAAEAYALGLLAFPPVPAPDLDTFTAALCARIAALSSSALEAIGHAQRTGGDLALDAGLELELELGASAVASVDGQEGVAAFLEKRPARFAPAGPVPGDVASRAAATAGR